MRRIIFYIGAPKTGTKAVQDFLLFNRRKLQEYGMDYLSPADRPSRKELVPFEMNGASFFKRAMATCGYQMSLMSQAWAEIFYRAAKEQVSDKIDTIFLSDENVFIYHRPEYLSALKDELLSVWGKDVRIEIICYLRRQDEWSLSMWKETCRTMPLEAMDYKPSLEGWQKPLLDYDSRLKGLESVFGRENIAVRRYDRACFSGGDIFHDFCQVAGIPWREDYDCLQPARNTSCTIAHTDSLRYLKTHFENASKREKDLFQGATRLLTSTTKEPKDMHILTREEREEMLAGYAASNQRVADRYFDGEPLFDISLGDFPVYVPDEEAIKQEAYRILYQAMVIKAQKEKQLPEAAPEMPLEGTETESGILFY